MIPIALVFAGVAAISGFTSAWLYQENRYEAKLAQQTTAHATALATANADALAKTLSLQKAKDDAEKKANARIASANRAISAANFELDGLRNELAITSSSLSTASCDSVRDYTATLNTVFGECTSKLGGLAKEADGHAIDSLKLQESWPK
jgi:chromosome segregation ATPase